MALLSVGLYVVGWYIVGMSITFTNKFLLSDKGLKLPFTLATVTNVMVSLIAWAATRPRAFRPEPLPWHTVRSVVIPIGVLTAMDIGCSNWALVHLSVAFHTIVRGTVPVFVLCFSLMMGLRRPSWRVCGAITTVCVGVALAAYGELECDGFGFAMALLSCFFSGLRWAMTQLLVQEEDPGGGAPGVLLNRRRSPLASIYYITPACAISSASAALLLERHAAMDASARMYAMTEELALYNGAISVLVFCLLFCEFGLVRLTSSLSLSGGG